MTSSNVLSGRWLTKFVWIAPILATMALPFVPSVFELDGNTQCELPSVPGQVPCSGRLPSHRYDPPGSITEIGGRFRPQLRELAALVLVMRVLACIGTFTPGYLLARGSGTAGSEGVTHHMFGAICLIIGVLACLLISVKPSQCNPPVSEILRGDASITTGQGLLAS